MRFLTLFLAGSFLCSSSAFAAHSLQEALKETKPYLDARYRFEHGAQSNLPEDARASTLRTRFGLQTGDYEGVSAVLEGQDIHEIGNDLYNNTLNGRTQFVQVNDVRSTRVNQALLRYANGVPNTTFTVGREALNIDNQRFIGTGEWRQENETLDLASISNTALPDTTAYYGYVNGVNRIFGEHSANGSWQTHAHLFNLQNRSLPIGTITPYAYLLDVQDSPLNSSQTYGVSLVGKQPLHKDWSATYRAEIATQTDYGNNPLSYQAAYHHFAGGLAWQGLQSWVGYETLGSGSGKRGFGTPLASLHAFNGWADVFTTTPVNGLNDAYVDVAYVVQGTEGLPAMLKGAQLRGQLHRFTAERGNDHYGNEWGVYTQIPVTEHAYVEAKLADYRADDYAHDLQRAIAGVGIRF